MPRSTGSAEGFLCEQKYIILLMHKDSVDSNNNSNALVFCQSSDFRSVARFSINSALHSQRSSSAEVTLTSELADLPGDLSGARLLEGCHGVARVVFGTNSAWLNSFRTKR